MIFDKVLSNNQRNYQLDTVALFQKFLRADTGGRHKKDADRRGLHIRRYVDQQLADLAVRHADIPLVKPRIKRTIRLLRVKSLQFTMPHHMKPFSDC